MAKMRILSFEIYKGVRYLTGDLYPLPETPHALWSTIWLLYFSLLANSSRNHLPFTTQETLCFEPKRNVTIAQTELHDKGDNVRIFSINLSGHHERMHIFYSKPKMVTEKIKIKFNFHFTSQDLINCLL